jgi:hypothetical protein
VFWMGKRRETNPAWALWQENFSMKTMEREKTRERRRCYIGSHWRRGRRARLGDGTSRGKGGEESRSVYSFESV